MTVSYTFPVLPADCVETAGPRSWRGRGGAPQLSSGCPWQRPGCSKTRRRACSNTRSIRSPQAKSLCRVSPLPPPSGLRVNHRLQKAGVRVNRCLQRGASPGISSVQRHEISGQRDTGTIDAPSILGSHESCWKGLEPGSEVRAAYCATLQCGDGSALGIPLQTACNDAVAVVLL